MLEDIRKIMLEETQNIIDIPDTDISIKGVSDLKSLSQYNFPCIDYRVKTRQFVCLFAVENSTKNVLSLANFIFLRAEDFDSTFFWRRIDGEDILKKVSLSDLAPDRTQNAMTLGFSLIPKGFTPAAFTAFGKRYMDIWVKCLSLEMYCYLETTGETSLDSRLTAQEKINLRSIDANFDFNLLGKTRDESKFSEQFAQYLEFKELKEVYNIRTLGKVFVK